MKKLIILLILLNITFSKAYSQYILKNKEDIEWYKGIPQENIYIAQNSDLLLAGEQLFYKIYNYNVKNNILSNNSKIAYIELIGEDNTIFKHKIKLKKGIGNGDFIIPSSINSGSYKLIAYTQWMQNSSADKYSQKNLSIINPYKEDAIEFTSDYNQSDIENVSITSDKIKLNIGSKSYGKRTMVDLMVNGYSGSIGNYSILVRKADDNKIINNKSNTTFNIDPKNINNEERSIGESILLPEYLGEMITGKVTSKKSGIAMKNIEVALSILSDEMHQDIVKTNSNGVFYFHLKQNYKNPRATIQVLGDFENEYNIELNQEINPNHEDLTFNTLKLNPNTNTILKQRSIHNQIQNAYYSAKRDTLIKDNYPKPFFGNYFEEYNLDDYKRFNTIEETLVEVVENAWSRKSNNGGREIDIREREFDPYYGEDIKPMIIVDGALVQNHQKVLDYEASKVKKIKVYRQEYYFNKRVYQGILLIETFDGNYADYMSENSIKKINLFKPNTEKKYFAQTYDNNTKLNRVPDFRHQLFWEPNFNLTKRQNKFQFYTSDVEGVFEIILEGLNSKGEYILVKELITVK